MKLKNSTAWPDYFLRRLISWACREIEMRQKVCRRATFRNSRASWGGCAHLGPRTITVCVGRAGCFPASTKTHANGHQMTLADREECLVWVTVHELCHLLQYAQQVTTRRQSTINGNHGGSEIATEWHAKPVVEAFRAERTRLLAEWSAAPARLATPQPGPSSAGQPRRQPISPGGIVSSSWLRAR